MFGPIRTLLVANRGEIACRVMRTAAQMGMRTVAVHSDPDRDALHVHEADLAVSLGGRTARESYLDIEKIIAAARATGADAIHPGYGFLAENDEFAEACAAAGLVFVGPSPTAIRDMGLKDRAKDLARQAGVPVLPDRVLNDDANVEDLADSIGLPLMVKAVAGGGGKGMRLVESREEIRRSIEDAQREAANSFGNSRVFVERYLATTRHIEIQVIADHHGNAVHLLDRECSIQRRHQKIIEEAPSPAISASLRHTMGEVSLRLVEQLGYTGVGTIEYLVTDEGSEAEFFFLEMNTRLQVEHPVTEEITGLDLVRLQLEVAAGLPLSIDQSDVVARGHAIEARLCAENPAADFLPSPGPVHRFTHLPLEGVRYEDGLAESGEVSAFYDPMIAKVVAHGTTREEAALRLANALSRLEIHGVSTNREHLVAILEDADFAAGDTTTAFIGDHPHLASAGTEIDEHRHLAVAVATDLRRVTASWPRTHGDRPGWRSVPGAAARTSTWERLDLGLGERSVTTRLATTDGSTVIELGIDGTIHEVEVIHEPLATVVAGIRVPMSVSVHIDGEFWVHDGRHISAWKQNDPLPDPASIIGPGSLRVEIPGTVVTVDVAEGDPVVAGQRLLVVEAMKMEHQIITPFDGVVTGIHVAPGDFVEPVTGLVTVEEGA